MKKIISPFQLEKVEYYCDQCGDSCIPSSTIKFNFGYGSGLDMFRGTLHLCHKCSKFAEDLAAECGKRFKTFELEEYSL